MPNRGAIHDRLTHDLNYAVDCFFPVLQSLQIKQEITGVPIFLSNFPLGSLNGINKWVITVIKTKLTYENRAIFIPQYFKNSGIMNCFIILDNSFYINARIPNENKVMIACHEFIHFTALLFASTSVTEELLNETLKERLSKKIDNLSDKNIFDLHQFLDTLRPFDDFEHNEQTEDKHFRFGIEKMVLSYSDLFKNLLLPRQLIDTYFTTADKEIVRDFFKNEIFMDAYFHYINIAKRIAQEEWLPENFAINQAIEIFQKFYINEI